MIDYGYVGEGPVSSGINEGFALRAITYNAEENYEACDVEFIRDEKVVRDRLFAPNGNKPRDKEDQETAKKREIGDFNNKMRSYLTNFVTNEKITETFKIKKPQSFKDLVNLYSSLLPVDSIDKKGRLLMWYKSSGYLEVPKYTSINNAKKLFSIDEDEDLELKKNYQDRLIKPEQKDKESFL